MLSRASQKRRRSISAAAAIEDTLRYTAFLATLAGIYVGVDEGIAAAFGKQRTAKWRALVAGLCAGPTLLWTGPKQRHYSLATYILLRGITLLVRVGNKPSSPPALRPLLAPTRLAHGDVLLMSAACGQILYAFIMMPQTLPPSYVRFIRRQGAKELWVWQGVRELAQRTVARRALAPLTSLIGTRHADAPPSQIPCYFFHEGQSCSGHVLSLLPSAYARALGVYLPVYLLPALLVHRQQLLLRPLPIARKAAFGIARSSAFLSLCIALAFGGACAGHRLTGKSTGAIIAASVWVGGLAVLAEKKSRRMELALYVAARSLESFCRCLLEWGALGRLQAAVPPRLDVLLFAAGCGAIAHCYSGSCGRHRDVFRSKYLNVLDLCFGNTGIEAGCISHVPSNQQLLSGMRLRVSASWHSLAAAPLGGADGDADGGSSGSSGSSGSGNPRGSPGRRSWSSGSGGGSEGGGSGEQCGGLGVGAGASSGAQLAGGCHRLAVCTGAGSSPHYASAPELQGPDAAGVAPDGSGMPL